MKPIRVLIADDHAVVREGLRTFIGSEPDMALVGEARNGVELVEQARALRPDIALVDLQMPQKDGLAAIAEIAAELPAVRLIVLTSFAEDGKVFAAIKAGAIGYLLKDSSPEELTQAIRDAHRGEPSLPATIALKLFRELKQPSALPPAANPLSEREVDVLKLVAGGLTNQEIADRLQISPWTVRTHVRNILEKLHLANRTQATLYALREGLVSLDGGATRDGDTSQ